MVKKLRVLDLFAGCGGLSKGLEGAGLEVVAANEIWSLAADTHQLNHPATRVIQGDITQVGVQQRIVSAVDGQVDLIVGGPPCEAYSLAGRRDPSDPRGKLFEEYVGLVERLKPRAFGMENVKGLLSMLHDREDLSPADAREVLRIRHDLQRLPHKYTRKYDDRIALKEGRTKRSQLQRELKRFQEPVTDMIARRFAKLGYEVEYKVLNAADYGVPQRRERVIFIGTRNGRRPRFPTPTHSQNGSNTLFDGYLEPWRTVRQAVDDLKDAPEKAELHHIYPRHGPQFIQKIKATPIGQSVFKSYGDAFFRCPPDEPARTVKENHNGVFVHYERDRVMTPRELARLQDFSDDFLFCGRKSLVLKLIGDAVPVGLGRAVGLALRQIVE